MAKEDYKVKSQHSNRKSSIPLMVILTIWLLLPSLVISCAPEPATAPALEPIPDLKPPLEPISPAGPTISIGDATTTIEGVVTIDISIDGVTEGISGYDLTVLLTGDSVAQIVDVVLPDFGLTDISELPSNTVTIMAVDLKDIVPSGTKKALLATVKLQGIGLGTSTIDVIVNAMDDDDGNPIEPYVSTGTIEVR